MPTQPEYRISYIMLRTLARPEHGQQRTNLLHLAAWVAVRLEPTTRPNTPLCEHNNDAPNQLGKLEERLSEGRLEKSKRLCMCVALPTFLHATFSGRQAVKTVARGPFRGN